MRHQELSFSGTKPFYCEVKEMEFKGCQAPGCQLMPTVGCIVQKPLVFTCTNNSNRSDVIHCCLEHSNLLYFHGHDE